MIILQEFFSTDQDPLTWHVILQSYTCTHIIFIALMSHNTPPVSLSIMKTQKETRKGEKTQDRTIREFKDSFSHICLHFASQNIQMNSVIDYGNRYII